VDAENNTSVYRGFQFPSYLVDGSSVFVKFTLTSGNSTMDMYFQLSVNKKGDVWEEYFSVFYPSGSTVGIHEFNATDYSLIADKFVRTPWPAE